MIITEIYLAQISRLHLRKIKHQSGKHQMQATSSIKEMAQTFLVLEVERLVMPLKCSSLHQVKEILVLTIEESNTQMTSLLKFSNRNLHQEVRVAPSECREFSKSWTITQVALQIFKSSGKPYATSDFQCLLKNVESYLISLISTKMERFHMTSL